MYGLKLVPFDTHRLHCNTLKPPGRHSPNLQVAACMLDFEKKRKSILDSNSPGRRMARVPNWRYHHVMQTARGCNTRRYASVCDPPSPPTSWILRTLYGPLS